MRLNLLQLLCRGLLAFPHTMKIAFYDVTLTFCFTVIITCFKSSSNFVFCTVYCQPTFVVFGTCTL